MSACHSPSRGALARTLMSWTALRASSGVEDGGAVAPGVEDVVDAVAHSVAGVVAINAGHEQVVVVGVDVADGGGDGEANGVGVERASGGAASDAATTAQGGGSGASAIVWLGIKVIPCRHGDDTAADRRAGPSVDPAGGG
jgi:hypothetical protein